MTGFHTISAILRGEWLLDIAFAHAHLPFIETLLTKGNLPDFSAFEQFSKIKTHSEFHSISNNANGGIFTADSLVSIQDAPKGSIAIIDISGPILKNGGACGEPGAIHFASWINAANQNPNIIGILLLIDSPGGMVSGTQTAADAVRLSIKPVISLINDGMMGSAATWIGTSALEVYASHKTDTIGSIGVFCTLQDFSKNLEMRGITVMEIYAPQSTDKNQDYYEALDNKPEQIKTKLKLIADQFISAVKISREGKLDITKGDPFTGKMFSADQALEIGLIDGFSTVQGAINRIMELSNQGKREQKLYI
jgi:protease-4